MWTRLASNLRSSCLSLSSVGITGLCQHAPTRLNFFFFFLFWFVGPNFLRVIRFLTTSHPVLDKFKQYSYNYLKLTFITELKSFLFIVLDTNTIGNKLII
jgi:hypothetical protein